MLILHIHTETHARTHNTSLHFPLSLYSSFRLFCCWENLLLQLVSQRELLSWIMNQLTLRVCPLHRLFSSSTSPSCASSSILHLTELVSIAIFQMPWQLRLRIALSELCACACHQLLLLQLSTAATSLCSLVYGPRPLSRRQRAAFKISDHRVHADALATRC